MSGRSRSRSPKLLTACAVIAALALGACGAPANSRNGPVVRVNPPSVAPPDSAISTLQPGPTPSPPPTPAPPTPPRPTPTPLEPPGGASIRAASGTQQGAPNSHCWSYGNGRSTCRNYPVPRQDAALAVRRGESVLLVLAATIPPTEETIRPFQGTRSGYPTVKIDPAIETTLEIALEPGDWEMDLCATWRGHGEPICWLFRLQVSG